MIMKAVFTQIYAQNLWGYGSGEGSLPEHTKDYRRFLERFIRDRQIKSVVDYGCGDWQFSRLIDWDGVRYLGLDVVDSLIEHNLKTYRKDNITFEVLAGTPVELPDAELIILKDVLQHWSHQSIRSFLPKIAKCKFALITNCVNPYGPTDNRDILDGDFRPLDLTRPPFACEMAKVFEFTNRRGVFGLRHIPRWKKIVLLQQNDAAE
jgi:SAM-dependent methyltransferase